MAAVERSESGKAALRMTILGLFFLSGACGLIYEVVWMRMLTLVFGATAFATSTILASFFTGLALGGAFFGRVIDKRGRPLFVYGLLEAGIGAFAFLMPVLLSGVTAVYVALSRNFEIGFYAISLVRAALSFLALLVPAILMGGTLPILVKFFVRTGRRLGWHVGTLYALNTFGAVVGTVSAGFFLILILGVRETAYAAGFLNLLIAAIVLLLDRRLARQPAEAPAQTAAEKAGDAGPPGSLEGPGWEGSGRDDAGIGSPRSARLALWAIAVSGFCALAYEVFWTRALVFFLDNSTHAFTTILTSFLVGIALGSLVAGTFADRLKALLGWLGVILVLIGGFAALAIPVLNQSTPVFERMAEANLDSTLAWRWMGLRFVNSLSVTLIPTVLMGMAFPLASKIYARNIGSVGRALGNVYAVNTFGGVLGSLLAGFALIPLLGVQTGILLMAAVNVGMGVIVVLNEPAMKRNVRLATAAGATAVAVGLLVGVFRSGSMTLISHYERLETDEVISYEEGIGGTVKVYRDIYGDRIISVNGFPVAGTPLEYHDAQKALAHFPLLLSKVPSPRVAIVGFGAGGTSWGSTQYEGSEVDCVELVPAVPRAAEWFREVNRGVLDQPNFNLIIEDGRNYMLVSDKEYDVISIDATSPKMAGNGALYSREFYGLLRDRLSEDGVVVQWIPYHLVSDSEARMTAKTFMSVFPHTSLWFTPLRQNVVLIGTRKELEIDFQGLEAKFRIESIQQDLAYVNVANPIDFLSGFVMGEEALAEYVEGARENTDNHPYLEFTPAMAYFVADQYRMRNLVNFRDTRESVLPWLVNLGETEEERAEVVDRVERRHEAVHYSINGDLLLFLRQRDHAIAEYEEALSIDPEEKNWLNAIWRYGNPRR